MDIVHDKEKSKFRVEVDGVTAYVAYTLPTERWTFGILLFPKK